jgi:hypothetical protein
MARRSFPWFRVSVLAAVLGVEALVLWRWGLDTLAQWLSVAGGGGVTVACVVWVSRGVMEWRLGSSGGVQRSSLDQVATDLSVAVRQTWTKEAAHRGLTSPLPIGVHLTSGDPQIAAHSAQWAASAGTAADGTAAGVELLTGTAAEVAAIYDRVATGRLPARRSTSSRHGLRIPPYPACRSPPINPSSHTEAAGLIPAWVR